MSDSRQYNRATDDQLDAIQESVRAAWARNKALVCDDDERFYDMAMVFVAAVNQWSLLRAHLSLREIHGHVHRDEPLSCGDFTLSWWGGDIGAAVRRKPRPKP